MIWVPNEFPYDILATLSLHRPRRANVRIWGRCKCLCERKELNIIHISWKLYVAVICVRSSANNVCFRYFLLFASPLKGWYFSWLDIATFVRLEFSVVVTKGTSFMVCDKCHLVDGCHCVGENSTSAKEAVCFAGRIDTYLPAYKMSHHTTWLFFC